LDERYEPIRVKDGDDIGSNRSSNRPFMEIATAATSRRRVLKGFLTSAAAGAASGMLGGTLTSRTALAADGVSTLTFTPPPHRITERDHVADGYTADVLIRWGDPVLADAPPFDPMNQTAAAQEKQFGYNCDYIAYMPLPLGSDSSDHGLLGINHEYTSHELMFPNWSMETQTPEQTQIELAAHGHSVIEVRRQDGKWQVVPDSPHARRISLNTECHISGPAAGHPRMQTNADPTGLKVYGVLNNCAGGTTPWGTVLISEENFHGYFGGNAPEDAPESENYARYGLGPESSYAWHRSVDRFDLAKEPNEPNRFGWMTEYDPYDASSTPVKRTALGRFKHEGATSILNPDGRVVLYSGDDERFDYLYRFVTAGRYDPVNREANRDLLDEGTLSVARFNDDGTLDWLPIVFGNGPLTQRNGFRSQADVLIETRRAADLLGATPMDRPEDVEPNPVNGRVYVMLTNNSRRKADQVDAVNPRPDNNHGQIAELIPPGGTGRLANHAADRFDWQLLLLAGNPADPEHRAVYHPATETWLSSPDNCAFDPQGRLWISTDQGSAQETNGIPDGMYACDLEGPGRALVKFFYALPRGAEMCGPVFTPDGKTLFLAVQHPAEWEGSTFENPATRWPDFQDDMPPRPSLVVVTKDDGGSIGS
ncbi:MAG TPA: PhoX family phosphatase, partial [Arenibaculum sp.]|nr:PhoX family phosphatase [Arenibaculum sp.]